MRFMALLCALLAVGCSGASTSVVRQAEPNPLRGATRIYLEPPAFEGRSAAVLEGYRAGFEQERVDVSGEHFKRVDGAADADFIVRTGLAVEVGSTTKVVILQNRLIGDVTITDAKGQLVDEFRTGTMLQSEATLRDASLTLGAAAGRYVRKRIED